MVNVSKEQIEALAKLQQIEIERAKIRKFLSNVPARIELLESKLVEFKEKMETENTAVAQQNQKYRAYESDVQDNLAKIKKSEYKLNAAKTNKEYQSSLKEIDDLKAIIAGIEDEMLSCLTLIENAEIEMKTSEQDYLKLTAETDTEREEINQEADRMKTSLDQLELDWTRVSSEIDAELMAKFNKVKLGQANGIAVAAVKSAVCQGCNMNIPPQMYNELQRGGTLKICPSCERIIYWENNENRSE